jgi:hypothetical protein
VEVPADRVVLGHSEAEGLQGVEAPQVATGMFNATPGGTTGGQSGATNAALGGIGTGGNAALGGGQQGATIMFGTY